MTDTHLNMLVNLLTQQNAETSKQATQLRGALTIVVAGVRRALLNTLDDLQAIEEECNTVAAVDVDQETKWTFRFRSNRTTSTIRQVLVALHSYTTLYDIPNILPRDFQEEPNAHIPGCECCHRANRASFGADGELLINQAPRKF